MGFLSLILFLGGMYGMYKVKNGYTVKGWAIVFVCVALIAAINGGDSDSSKDKPEQSQKQEKKVEKKYKQDWNMNFDDENAIRDNMKQAVKMMEEMDNVASHAERVSPADVINNPDNYMGRVLEFSATVGMSEDLPSNNNAAIAMGGNAHLITAETNDGTIVFAVRKGDKDSDNGRNIKIGDWTIIVGMPAGIRKMPPEVGGATTLVIICDPK